MLNVQAICRFGSLFSKQKLFALKSLLHTEVHKTLKGMGEFKICFDFQNFCSFETLMNCRMGIRTENIHFLTFDTLLYNFETPYG